MKHRSDRVPVGVSLSGSAAGCPGENLLYQDWNNALANISPVSKISRRYNRNDRISGILQLETLNHSKQEDETNKKEKITG